MRPRTRLPVQQQLELLGRSVSSACVASVCFPAQELMADPVMVATGHTYDRVCIERWLAQGNRTCPVTGMRLRHLELTPNFALRNAIQVRRWTKAGLEDPSLSVFLDGLVPLAAAAAASRVQGCSLEAAARAQEWASQNEIVVPHRENRPNAAMLYKFEEDQHPTNILQACCLCSASA